MNKRKEGTKGEELAIEYLQKMGLEIIEKNYHNRYGEIDIIVRDKDVICFMEVKLRTDNTFGDPLESVGVSKQRKIRGVARHFLYSRKYNEDYYCRFDVVGIMKNENGDYDITWIKDAF